MKILISFCISVCLLATFCSVSTRSSYQNSFASESSPNSQNLEEANEKFLRSSRAEDSTEQFNKDDDDDGNAPAKETKKKKKKEKTQQSFFDSIGDMLTGKSINVDDDDIKYLFYSKKNKKKEVMLKLTSEKDDDDLKNWKVDEACTILIHGWIDEPPKKEGSSLKIKDAYLGEEDKDDNIIVVDWSKFSQAGFYVDSSKMVKKVADVVTDFVVHLVEANFVENYSKIHIIGFSLGAHIAGIIGSNIQKKNKKIGWITGLDPNWENFDGVDEDEKLDKEDAKFVDILHCNMGHEFGKFGTEKKIGTADFFPNGGIHQPGCGENLIGVCSTNKCVDIYVETIKGTKYRACKCEDWKEFEKDECSCDDSTMLGDMVSKLVTGKFYVSTKKGESKNKDEE